MSVKKICTLFWSNLNNSQRCYTTLNNKVAEVSDRSWTEVIFPAVQETLAEVYFIRVRGSTLKPIILNYLTNCKIKLVFNFYVNFLDKPRINAPNIHSKINKIENELRKWIQFQTPSLFIGDFLDLRLFVRFTTHPKHFQLILTTTPSLLQN